MGVSLQKNSTWCFQCVILLILYDILGGFIDVVHIPQFFIGNWYLPTHYFALSRSYIFSENIPQKHTSDLRKTEIINYVFDAYFNLEKLLYIFIKVSLK